MRHGRGERALVVISGRQAPVGVGVVGLMVEDEEKSALGLHWLLQIEQALA
jgi:hypothetical protein